MNEKIIAAKLFQLKSAETDPVLIVIKSAQLLKGVDVDAVLRYYKEISAKKLIIANIVSAADLNPSEKEKIKQTLSKKFTEAELVCVFSLDKNAKGLNINVADNVIDFSSTGTIF
jgi:F0F1-type ATP synthase delta subunit